MVIIDAESAFLQPRLATVTQEQLVVNPPKDSKKPGKLWDMQVPLYGWRLASASW